MNSTPLHPLLVHVPLGLAMLMPLVAAGFAWAVLTGRVRPGAWLAVVVLQSVLLGAGLLAINTGGAEEDRVERVVPEGALHQHKESAEQFVWATGATLALAALVLVFRRPVASRALTAFVVAGTVGVAGLAVRTGHAGGQLVYVHGAAGAYTSTAQTPSGKSSTPPSAPRRHDDD